MIDLLRPVTFGSALVLGVSFSDRITLGSAMVMGVLGIAAIFNILGGGKRWKDNFEAEKERSSHLYERCTDYAVAKNEIERKYHELEIECASLRERPNFEDMMRMLESQDKKATERTVASVDALMMKIDERFEESDKRHALRHRETAEMLARTVEALERMAGRQAA